MKSIEGFNEAVGSIGLKESSGAQSLIIKGDLWILNIRQFMR